MRYATRSPTFAITYAAAPAAQRARSRVFIQKEREGKSLALFSAPSAGSGPIRCWRRKRPHWFLAFRSRGWRKPGFTRGGKPPPFCDGRLSVVEFCGNELKICG